MTSVSKTSTIRIFTYVHLVILGLFALVTLFTVSRLNEVFTSLESLTDITVPQIFEANTVSHYVDELATLTVSLSNARTLPAKRLINLKIDKVVEQLNGTVMAQSSQNAFLYKQISVLAQELEELNSLVERQIIREQQLGQDKAVVYNYLQSVITSTATATDIYNTELVDIMLLTTKIDQQNRLHELRELERELEQKINNAKLLTNNNLRRLDQLVTISDMLLAKSGIVNQKVELLRIAGRTRGRGNFVSNLVQDVANSLEHRSRLIYQQTKRQSDLTEQRIAQQNNIAVIAGSFTILLTLIAIYFLHKRVVSRLLSLTEQVDKATDKKLDSVHINGRDEITHLADTFSLYLSTVREQEQALVSMSLTDALTDIPNRRAFNLQLDTQISQATRHRWPLSVLLIDVDYFKSFNDFYGHGEGDACLRAVAKELYQIVQRNTDFCARFGGEEFVCVLPDTDAAGAQQKSEELRKAIEDMAIEHACKEHTPVVTISVGSATFPFSSHNVWSHDAIIEKTDSALYDAKAKGRNCCVNILVS